MQVNVSASELQAMIAAKGKPSFDVLARAAGPVEAVYEDHVPEALGELVDAWHDRPEYRLRVVVGDRWIVVGGIHHDDDCENPLDGDGMGRILQPSQDNSEIQAALGLDQYGDRLTNAEPVQAILFESMRKRIGQDRNLKARLTRAMVRHGRRAEWFDSKLSNALASGGNIEDFTMEFAGHYPYSLQDTGSKADLRLVQDCEALAEAAEQLAGEAWKQARREGKVGEPLAVLLDVYQHGQRHYSLAGQGPQCPWDTSSPGAMWVPDDCAKEGIAMQVASSGVDPIEAARRSAAIAASEYTKWVNGETFGFTVQAFDKATGKPLDTRECSLWGLIGADYATDKLEGAILGMIPSLNAAVTAH